MTISAAPQFCDGATAIRRDIFQGKVWTASPHRVVRDTGHELVLAYWPGIRSLAPTTWIDGVQTGDPAARDAAITSLAARRWDLGLWTWRETAWLGILTPGAFFSVNLFFTEDHELARWYVNFQRPYERTGNGIDTFDLFVDLVVAPDLSRWEWKDEDEYRHARRVGVVTDAEHRGVQEARQEAVAMIEDRCGAFGAGWPGWRRDPAWPDPVLSADAAASEATMTAGPPGVSRRRGPHVA